MKYHLIVAKMIITEFHLLRILYERFGVLGVTARILGQFPVSANLSGDTLVIRFSWRRLATLYNIFWSVCPFVFGRLPNAVLYDSTVNYIYQCALLTVSSVASITGWVDVCSLLYQLDKYDSHTHRVPVLTKRVTKCEKGFVWIAIPVIYLAYVLFSYPGQNQLHNIFYFILRSLYHSPELLQCILYFFFCNEIYCRILQLHTSWLKYVQLVCRQNTDKSRLRMDHYRALNVELLNCVDSLNAAFGLKVATFCALLACNVLVLAYIDFTECNCFLFWNRELLLCLLLVIAIGYFSRKLHAVSNVMLNKIFDEEICSRNECLRLQMDLLVYQLDRNKVQVLVPGVVHLSKHFTGSFLCAIVTYFILVTQVAVDIEGE